MSESDAHRTADAVARRSYGKLVAFLAARTHDVAAAADALSEAFASALATWLQQGCPSNPEAWLLAVARRKMIDVDRRRRTSEDGAAQVQILAEGLNVPADAEIPDQRLALLFACAHPAIEAGIRAPLMLQVVLGLDAQKSASAFLTSPAAMGKRLVRATRQRYGRHWPLSIGRRIAVGPCASLSHRLRQLARGGAAVRRFVRNRRITGGRDQSCARHRRGARRRRRSRSDAG